MAAGHLVAHRKLALHGDVDLHQLDDAGRQFVALAQLGDLFVGDLSQHLDLARGHLLDFVDLLVDARILVGEASCASGCGSRCFSMMSRSSIGALGEQALVGLLVVQVGKNFLAFQQRFQALQALVGEDADFVRQVLLQLRHLLGLDELGALVLLLTLAGEDLAHRPPCPRYPEGK